MANVGRSDALVTRPLLGGELRQFTNLRLTRESHLDSNELLSPSVQASNLTANRG